jgi:two-component sensor histidine kinase
MSLEPVTVAQDICLGSTAHLLEEFSHRVLNEYTVAIGDLSLAASRSASELARSTLHRAAERLRLHADAHRALLAPRVQATMDLAAYLDRVCESTCRALLDDRKIRLIADMDKVWLDPNRCWRIGLIVAELIRNAVRHGLAGRAGCVRVVLSENAYGVSCIVMDNGRGAAQASPGRGCRLIEALASELGGIVLWRFSPGGCVAELQMPTGPNGDEA